MWPAWLVAASVARPDGVGLTCVPWQYNQPPIPSVLAADTASITCTGGACVLSATRAFKGVVLGVSEGIVATAEDQGLELISDKRCFRHTRRLSVDQIPFEVTSDAESVVRAVVVFERNGASHVFAKADTIVQKAPRQAYVIGAGPGGLGAAKALTAMGVSVTVYERGPATPVDFDGPIQKTYHSNPESASNQVTIKGFTFGQGPGGTQSINGAVYAPGSPQDLAKSVGVNINDARLAQQQAATMVPHKVDPPMMWECIDPNDCDFATVAATNTKMKRRSIAFPSEDLSQFTIVSDCRVDLVNDEQIIVRAESDLCKHVTIAEGTIVVVAAGALVSPEIIEGVVKGETYQAWNHYYKDEFIDTIPEKQTFEYENSGAIEINTAKIVLPSDYGEYEKGIKITMNMIPTVRETIQKGESPYVHELPDFLEDEELSTNAWHYAGTVPHDKLKVDGLSNVWIGDASALKTPFNCHTSMPAVAAGILAARAATGLLDGETNVMEVSGPAPVLFAVGAWVVLLGIAVHTVDRIKWHHYWIMPLGIVVIWAGILVAMTGQARQRRGTAHAYLGYTVAALLIVQAIGGSALSSMETRPMWLRKGHRLSGIAALVGLNALYLGATWGDDGALAAYNQNTTAYEASGWAFLAVSVVVTARASRWFLSTGETAIEWLLQ